MFVHVRWRFHDAHRRPLTDTASRDVPRQEGEGFHACDCIETEAAKKLPVLAAGGGSELSPPVT